MVARHAQAKLLEKQKGQAPHEAGGAWRFRGAFMAMLTLAEG
jgi:hypothetical protein